MSQRLPTVAVEHPNPDATLRWNDDPKPFIWTKTADEIFERLARYLQARPSRRRSNAAAGPTWDTDQPTPAARDAAIISPHIASGVTLAGRLLAYT